MLGKQQKDNLFLNEVKLEDDTKEILVNFYKDNKIEIPERLKKAIDKFHRKKTIANQNKLKFELCLAFSELEDSIIERYLGKDKKTQIIEVRDAMSKEYSI